MSTAAKEVQCPSGAILRIYPSPFSDAKNLYQSLLRELKDIKLYNMEWEPLAKDLICASFSSAVVEACVWECMKRCTYSRGIGEPKITKDTFEPVECRQDYITVMTEVAKENVSPFLKNLYAVYKQNSSQMQEANPA